MMTNTIFSDTEWASDTERAEHLLSLFNIKLEESAMGDIVYIKCPAILSQIEKTEQYAEEKLTKRYEAILEIMSNLNFPVFELATKTTRGCLLPFKDQVPTLIDFVESTKGSLTSGNSNGSWKLYKTADLMIPFAYVHVHGTRLITKKCLNELLNDLYTRISDRSWDDIEGTSFTKSLFESEEHLESDALFKINGILIRRTTGVPIRAYFNNYIIPYGANYSESHKSNVKFIEESCKIVGIPYLSLSGPDMRTALFSEEDMMTLVNYFRESKEYNVTSGEKVFFVYDKLTEELKANCRINTRDSDIVPSRFYDETFQMLLKNKNISHDDVLGTVYSDTILEDTFPTFLEFNKNA